MKYVCPRCKNKEKKRVRCWYCGRTGFVECETIGDKLKQQEIKKDRNYD